MIIDDWLKSKNLCQEINCSTGVLQELLWLFSRFISRCSLSEFILDGLARNVVIDLDAMRQVLEETNKMTKLGIRNANKVHPESLEELIAMIVDLI